MGSSEFKFRDEKWGTGNRKVCDELAMSHEPLAIIYIVNPVVRKKD